MTRAAGVLQSRQTADPVDFRDAIRSQSPLVQISGLTLDFVSKVVFAPLMLFLVVDNDGEYCLSTVKADSILTPDSCALASEYLECVGEHDPIFDMASSCGRTKLLSRENLAGEPTFTKSQLATGFLDQNDLGPIAALYMRDDQSGRHCLLLLVRTSEESEFSTREKSFLHQAAPLMNVSTHLAMDLGGVEPGRVATGAGLTTREEEIAILASRGARNDEIASSLNIASGTVKCHIRNIYAKLGVDSRIHLALAIEDSGSIPPTLNGVVPAT